MKTVAVLITLLGVTMAAPATAQPRRVDPGAREILAYRLTADSLRRVDAVMREMDRATEAPRSDVAMIGVLSGAWASGNAWRDRTADDAVRTIETGHSELSRAVRSAGLSTRDYVLTMMTLMLAHPTASMSRQGRGVTTTDVAAENVAWVEANWYDVDRFMRDLQQRMDVARRR